MKVFSIDAFITTVRFSFETFKEEIKATVVDKDEFENLGKRINLAHSESFGVSGKKEFSARKFFDTII